jgi:hypothetical protein
MTSEIYQLSRRQRARPLHLVQARSTGEPALARTITLSAVEEPRTSNSFLRIYFARRMLDARWTVNFRSALFLLLISGIASAHAQIYVANNGGNTVGKYALNGATINASLISGLDKPIGIAVADGFIYVANFGNGTVGKYTVEGAVVNASLISGLGNASAVAIAGGNLYVASISAGTIGKYTTSGAVVNASVVTGLNGPAGIAVSPTENALYVTNLNGNTAGKYTLDGAVVKVPFVTNLDLPAGIAVAPPSVFITENVPGGGVAKFITNGGEDNRSLITGLDSPAGITVFGGHVFVTARGAGTIGEYTDTGGQVNATLVTGLNAPMGVAVVLPPATPTPTPTPTPVPGSIGNISTRLRVETADNVLIGGFIVTGNSPKRVIIRAIGPSLPVADALADPTLEVYDNSGNLVATNDNWIDSPDKQAIIDTTVPPGNDLESAVVGNALPGAYTAIVRGVNGGTGVGLVEVYDLNQFADSRLANISTRGLVRTGDNVMIGGLFVVGSTSQNVIVRAIGPSLPVDGKLLDPTVELRDGNGGLLDANDNWRSDHEAEIIATTVPPTADAESAVLQTLAPGPYTAIVRGVNDTTGVALVEVYALQ